MQQTKNIEEKGWLNIFGVPHVKNYLRGLITNSLVRFQSQMFRLSTYIVQWDSDLEGHLMYITASLRKRGSGERYEDLYRMQQAF